MPIRVASNGGSRILQRCARILLCGLTAAFLAAPSLFAVDFPPITEAERALKTIQGVPNARGVVLFRKGELQLRDASKGDASSRLTIQGRIKVLTEEGKGLGEIEIANSNQVRLSGFAGRTVLPDGTAVPLPEDAKFERRLSKSRKLYVTAVAFPAVQVGAILDFRYDLYFDSYYLLEPWYFSGELTTLHSEITYLIPLPMAVQTWRRDPFQIGIQLEDSKTVQGFKVRAWADRLPPVPDEPYQIPFEDLAAQIVLLPVRWSGPYEKAVLMESWAATSELLLGYYETAIRQDGDAGRRAREIAGAAKTPREQAAALYRFVRDTIETDNFENVIPSVGHDAAGTLKSGRGDSVDKSLLLIALLKAAKIKAKPVWAARRERGLIDSNLANPEWFQRMLVALDLDGKRVFLDPSDRALGFGQLDSDYEGMVAVLPDRRSPEILVLPESPWEQNRSAARLQLEIDGQGVTRGTGNLVLTGHPASGRIHWRESEEKTVSAWKEWLTERHKDFAISEVKVTESPEDRKVEVRWSMAQREEEALGDELSLAPSRPFGPSRQPFNLPSAQRRSPILFDYGDRDEMEVELRWPDGWILESRPKPVDSKSPGLAFQVEVAVKPEERTLTYRRRFDIGKKLFASREECEAVRTTFEAATKSDAEALVLVRR